MRNLSSLKPALGFTVSHPSLFLIPLEHFPHLFDFAILLQSIFQRCLLQSSITHHSNRTLYAQTHTYIEIIERMQQIVQFVCCYLIKTYTTLLWFPTRFVWEAYCGTFLPNEQRLLSIELQFSDHATF